MTVSIVSKKSFGLSFDRLDAEFVEFDSLSKEKALRQKLMGNQLIDLINNNDEDKKSAEKLILPIKYLSINSIDTIDGLAFASEYQAKKVLPSRAKYIVKVGDILVSNVRPNRGAISIIGKHQEGMIASSGFTLIRLDEDSNYSPEYVFALLKTPFMREQLVRRNRGSMYPAVLQADVLDLFCPRPQADLNKKVVSLIQKATLAQENFFKLKDEAFAMLNLLIKPIGSPPSPMKTTRTGVDWTEVHSGDFFDPTGACRIDAEFFRDEYKKFDNKCIAFGNSFLLGDYFDISPGRALKASGSETYYAKQGILTNIGINWSAIEKESGSIAKNSWVVKENDILLACTAHEVAYVGRKADVVSEIPDYIDTTIACVPDIMIFRPKEDTPLELLHYTASFLRHPAGLYQVQRCIRGLRGGHVYKSDLSQYVRVPMPDKRWLKEFDKLERKAEILRNRAKELTQEAIDCVSEMISRTQK